MADKKKTVSKTTAPKRARKVPVEDRTSHGEVTTDDHVTTDDGVTTQAETIEDETVTTHDDSILVSATREDVKRFVTQATYDLVAQRAYERFLARGGEHGHDLEDWLAAEEEAAQH